MKRKTVSEAEKRRATDEVLEIMRRMIAHEMKQRKKLPQTNK